MLKEAALFYLADEAVAVGKVDRKSTRLNSSHVRISYAVFCLKKKNKPPQIEAPTVLRLEPRGSLLADELAAAPAGGLSRQPDEVVYVCLRHVPVKSERCDGAH